MKKRALADVKNSKFLHSQLFPIAQNFFWNWKKGILSNYDFLPLAKLNFGLATLMQKAQILKFYSSSTLHKHKNWDSRSKINLKIAWKSYHSFQMNTLFFRVVEFFSQYCVQMQSHNFWNAPGVSMKSSLDFSVKNFPVDERKYTGIGTSILNHQ